MAVLDHVIEQAISLPREDRYELSKFLNHALASQKIRHIKRTKRMQEIREAFQKEYAF